MKIQLQIPVNTTMSITLDVPDGTDTKDVESLLNSITSEDLMDAEVYEADWSVLKYSLRNADPEDVYVIDPETGGYLN